jgi:hypothetical protein
MATNTRVVTFIMEGPKGSGEGCDLISLTPRIVAVWKDVKSIMINETYMDRNRNSQATQSDWHKDLALDG